MRADFVILGGVQTVRKAVRVQTNFVRPEPLAVAGVRPSRALLRLGERFMITLEQRRERYRKSQDDNFQKALADMISRGYVQINGFHEYVVGPDGLVFAYRLDRIKNNGTGRWKQLKGTSRGGYRRVKLSDGVQLRCFSVHRLVAEAFIPNPNQFPIINHIDGEKSNNRVPNLEWCTYSYNMRHAHATGLNSGCKGERQWKAKLSEDDIPVIRVLAGQMPQRAIAKHLCVSEQAISYVINGKTWRHVA